MKIGIKLGNIKVNEMQLENIELNLQYTAEELRTEYALVKEILADMPKIASSVANGYLAFEELDSTISNINTEDTEKSSALDKVRDVIKKIGLFENIA